MTSRKPRKPAALLVFLAAAMLPPALRAQDGSSIDFLDLLAQENHVFSASRYVQTISETPANVTILTQDDIRRFGYRSIQEALQSLPGLYDAASQWPALGVRGLAVPGDFGSRILYLVNGMPVYEPTYGGFFIETVDVESIDRIEFVKGAGSALYGSGAVLAVVNLITRSGRDGGKSLSVEAASHRMRKLHGSWGKLSEGGVDTFVSVSTTHGAGRDIYLREFDTPAYDNARFGGVSAGNDSLHNARLFARMGTQEAWVQGLFVAADKRDPLASYGSIFNGRLTLKEQLGALEAGLNHELGAGAKMVARAYVMSVAEKGDYPYASSGMRVPPADYINVTDLASRQAGAELRYDRFLASGHHLLAGIEAKRITSFQQAGDQPGTARSGVLTVDTSPSYGQWAVFLQDEMRLGAGTLFLGARFDAYKRFSEGVKSRLSPRVAYVHELSTATTAKLIFGEAYRAPTVYESRYQDGQPAASTLWANPLLRPELARSFEALLEHQSQPGVKWRLSAFHNRLKDSPVQVVTPVIAGIACALGPEGCIQYRNSGATQRVAGIEADVRIKQSDRSNLYASVVLQNGKQAGEDLASSPRRQFKSGYSSALPWPGMDAALEVHYVSRAEGRIEAGGTRTAGVPAQVLLNAALNAGRVAGKWRLSLRASNLLNKTIYTVASRELQPLERVPGAGRRLSLQMQLDF
jgi:outer membrane cobalamin receptor